MNNNPFGLKCDVSIIDAIQQLIYQFKLENGYSPIAIYIGRSEAEAVRQYINNNPSYKPYYLKDRIGMSVDGIDLIRVYRKTHLGIA